MFFSNRVVDQWNTLPHDVVTAKSLNIFKNKLDTFNNKHEQTASIVRHNHSIGSPSEAYFYYYYY